MIVDLVQPLTRPILSSLTDAITAALGGFSPRALFSAGEQGAWYDLSDSTTLFADSAGTTTAVLNGPVGLVLDKSQGLVLGAEIALNSEFDTDTVWTKGAGWTITGGALVGGTATGGSFQRVGTEDNSNAYYEYTVVVSSYTSGSVQIGINSSPGGLGVDNIPPISSAGTFRYRARSTGTTNYIYIIPTNFVGAISSISAKRVSGNHAYQTTATSRPTLRGTPTGLDGDGTDDALLCASAGGGTTGFLFQAAIRPDVISKRQTIWSDAGTNTGYKVELNASNQLVFSAGNGTAYTSVTTANTVAAGTTYSVECYDDGTNLVAILNQGTPATAARPTVSAGTTGFTMQKDNGAASGFMDGLLCSVIYLRNTAKNSATRAQSMRWIRQKAGL